MTAFVYLSPHLDDAVYSCGGLIAQQVRLGHKVQVITVCAGDPPDGSLSPFAMQLHMRWGAQDAPIENRRMEDRAACARLGASFQHWDVPDAIYRRNSEGQWLYQDEQAIFGPLHPDEHALACQLGDRLREQLSEQDVLLSPLGVGGHVDHRLARRIAEHCTKKLWYYRELPYAWRGHTLPGELTHPKGEQQLIPLERSDVQAWIEAAACYQSQISTFWESRDALRQDFTAGVANWGGLPLTQSRSHEMMPVGGEEDGQHFPG